MNPELPKDIQQRIVHFAVNLESNGRVPEDHGVAGEDEASRYIAGTSYPENSDYILFTWEADYLFGLAGKRVAEFCTGPGDLAKRIAEQDTSCVYGIDGSDSMIAYAQENHTMPNLTYLKENIFSLNGNLSKRDLIVCQNSLHHFENKSLLDFFQSGVDHLKTGGSMYVADYRRENIDPEILIARLRSTNSAVVDDLMHTIQASFTKKELEDTLSSLGKGVRVNVFYPNREHDILKRDYRYHQVVGNDPHPHYLDYRLSLRVEVKKI